MSIKETRELKCEIKGCEGIADVRERREVSVASHYTYTVETLLCQEHFQKYRDLGRLKVWQRMQLADRHW